MTKAEIVIHNENLARAKVISAYQQGDLHEAMRLCALYTGRGAKEAYETVLRWVEESEGE